jgi:hypothetical protein
VVSQAEPEDPIEGALRRARIVAIAPARGPAARAGVFDATLEGTGEGGRRGATLAVALGDAPVAWRRPLAYYRLARALGMEIVPAAAVRRVSTGELGELLVGQAGALALLRGRAAIQNDGTVDALLIARAPEGSLVDPKGGGEVATWERWAAAAAPAAGEEASLVRGYVEMLVLDYLAAHAGRRRALVVGRSIVLDENDGAFPLRADPASVDGLLRRLRAVARFPRGLPGALARLDRARAKAIFLPGEFEAWLLPPRALVDLDERRESLLSLIEARVLDRGAESVLSL